MGYSPGSSVKPWVKNNTYLSGIRTRRGVCIIKKMSIHRNLLDYHLRTSLIHCSLHIIGLQVSDKPKVIARSDGIFFARFREGILLLKRQARNGLGSKQPLGRRNQRWLFIRRSTPNEDTRSNRRRRLLPNMNMAFILPSYV
jgi:hypothetical protein